MQLDGQNRQVLFNATSEPQQLQKFLFKQKDYTATMDELKDIFSDISKAAFLSMLFSLKGRRVIEITGDRVYLNVDMADIKTTTVDIVWKDAKLLKVFTRIDIEKDTGIAPVKIREALRVLTKEGLIRKHSRQGNNYPVYQLITTESCRKPPKRQRKNSKAEKIFNLARKLNQPFRMTELKQCMAEHHISASDGYVKQLFKQWLNLGVIAEANTRTNPYQRILYKVVDSKRPAVFKGYRK